VFLDHQKAAASTSTMSAFFVCISDQEKEMHQRIEFVVMMNLPVSFVDCVHTRAISQLNQISG
jgi:ribulose 1,5-bisphosphate carboxylase large subunit-like protein